jgi:hypothetical protein
MAALHPARSNLLSIKRLSWLPRVAPRPYEAGAGKEGDRDYDRMQGKRCTMTINQGRRTHFPLRVFLLSILAAMSFSLSCLETLPTVDIYVPFCDNTELKGRHHPAIGDYTVYYGGFHNHTSISDGVGTPEEAYRYGKCVAGLDFMGISDHGELQTAETYSSIKAVADSYNADSIFVTFWGFEWTSSTNYGHLTVVNAEDFTSTSNPQTQTFQQLCLWLSARNCFAILNHPGFYNGSGTEFEHFQGPVCGKIVGMELWNKTAGFPYFYYNDGYDTADSGKGFYDEALSRGWKIGAAGGFDDHNATWGTAQSFRVAVLAKNLTRQDILEAMTARRFFSTEIKSIALSFTVAGEEMGSTVPSAASAPMRIQASDGDNGIFTEVVLFDKNHDTRRTWHPGTAAVDISDTLMIAAGDYYYVKVTEQNTGEAISSPIWVSNGEPSIIQ